VALLTAVTLSWDHSYTVRYRDLAASGAMGGWHELSVTYFFVHRAAHVDWTAFPPTIEVPLDVRQTAIRVGTVVSALIGAAYAALFFLRRRRPISPHEVGILFLLMFLIAPWNHDYYYLFALVPFSILFVRSLRHREWAVLGLSLLAYSLISPPIPFSIVDRLGILPSRLDYVLNLNDIPLYGGLLLLGLSTYGFLREPAAGTLGEAAAAPTVRSKRVPAPAG